MHVDHIEKLDQGVVVKKSVAGYEVRQGDRSIACRFSPLLGGQSRLVPALGRSSREASAQDDSLAVGDVVRFIETGHGAGQIVDVLPRRNHLARRAAASRPGAYAGEQVIAANVDQVVPVFAAARPEPHWRLLDRYLVAAEAAGLPVLVCITKLDLAQNGAGAIDAALAEKVAEYRRIGYAVLLVSAQSGAGLEDLKPALQGRTSLLLGKSGVGKTSLLNALQPGLGLRVKEVSRATGKGRHTTTHLEMFPFDFGGAVIDTPGMREFAVWEVEGDDLAYCFPEMRPFIGRCKFGLDCQHDEEPGCAVRRAVMQGVISPARYQSYMFLREEP
jgi:ribosome biogenesis GTPase / thiamine phosphate phosphatase